MMKTSAWDYMFLNSILCDIVSVFLYIKMFFDIYVSPLCILNDIVH